MRSRGVTALLLCVLFITVSCSSPEKQISPIRSDGMTGQNATLPFESTFTQRWNSRNDGSSYEPCVSLDAASIADLQVDPDSVSDAAGTDGQTGRGCYWKFQPEVGDLWSVQQGVANSESFDAYKRKNRHRTWQKGISIGGRNIGISGREELGECLTYVQSRDAGVVSIVVHHRRPHPPINEICDRAIAFTKATINKMPR